MYSLTVNSYGATDTWGRVVPTEEALQANSNTDNNEYGVWRARNHQGNRLYYNPEVTYEPWVGHDANNVEFADAVDIAIRLDPNNASPTFNMLTPVSYTADNVPDWDNNGGTEDVAVSNFYIPRYYTTPVVATPADPLDWDDTHTLVEIVVGNTFNTAVTRVDCADWTACTYDEEIQNFANWFQYYRNREYSTKGSMGPVIQQITDLYVGLQTINDRHTEDIALMNELYSEGEKKELLDEFYGIDSSGGTPLRRALERAGDLFECAPGSGGSVSGAGIPMGNCQSNYTLLFSDGYWNGGDPNNDGNYDEATTSAFDGGRYADTRSETLADVAMFYYENDLQPLLDNDVAVSSRDVEYAPVGTFGALNESMHQHMKTFTIAFGVDGTFDPGTIPTDVTDPFTWSNPHSGTNTKIDDMIHAALNGRGRFLNANNPQELEAAFQSIFLEVTQAGSSVSAPAFNSTSLRDGTFLFRGFFDLRTNTGDLTATLVNPDGSLAAAPAWRAADRLNGVTAASRKIFTWDNDPAVYAGTRSTLHSSMWTSRRHSRKARWRSTTSVVMTPASSRRVRCASDRTSTA